MKTKPMLQEVREYWEAKGWDPDLLKNFTMTNVDTDPEGLVVPGGLEGADPPKPDTPPSPPAPPNGKVWTEEEVNAERERVRQEEKDKLYPRLSTMEEELKKVREDREAETKAQTAAREKAEAEAKSKAEEEMSAKELLAAKEQEWKNEIAALRSERERDAAMLEAERRFAAVESYKTRRMAEEAEHIMPELRDLVTGSTEQEVENSIATAVSKTGAILENIKAHQQQQRQQQRGTSITTPPAGPLENDATYETITAEDIRNMNPAEYAKNRDKLLQAASASRRGGVQ
jgi:hypothetical protein